MTQSTYQMMSKKKEGVAPGSRKAQCSSVGKYQNRVVGMGGGGVQGDGRGLMGLWGSWKPGKGKSFEM